MIKNITNEKFGRLTVIKRVDNDSFGSAMWFCKCECRNELTVRGAHLRSGQTKSCGCLQIERARKFAIKNFTTHGNTETPEYESWQHIKGRCYNKKNSAYKNYGGRGIKMCDRWLDSFENFLEDVGLKPSPNHSIDRINNNGNYEPKNVRWATDVQQMNNMRTNRLVSYNNHKFTVSQLSKLFKINYHTLYSRLFIFKWSVHKALHSPIVKK